MSTDSCLGTKSLTFKTRPCGQSLQLLEFVPTRNKFSTCRMWHLYRQECRFGFTMQIERNTGYLNEKKYATKTQTRLSRSLARSSTEADGATHWHHASRETASCAVGPCAVNLLRSCTFEGKISRPIIARVILSDCNYCCWKTPWENELQVLAAKNAFNYAVSS